MTETHSQDDLSSALVALRTSAGLRQVDVAARTSISQARLSRAENGLAMLSPDEIAVLAQLYGTEESHRAALIGLAKDAQASYVDARVVLQSGGTANLQRRFAALERPATEVRAFQPLIILGVLQTAAYASAVFGVPADDQLVQQRLVRRRRMLEDARRHWVLIQTEGAMRWHIRSPELMIAQVDQIIELSRLPNVDIGLIGWRTPTTVFPATAFHLYDRSTAVVGTKDGTAIITEPDRLASYRAHFDELAAAATVGDECRTRLARIADDFRELSKSLT